jgi:hypothetical protein
MATKTNADTQVEIRVSSVVRRLDATTDDLASLLNALSKSQMYGGLQAEAKQIDNVLNAQLQKLQMMEFKIKRG